MKISRWRVVPALVCLSSWLGAEQLAIKSYTTADGLLTDGEIVYMMQSSQGYLWIGGWLGVSRFDGHAFRTYGEADGLPQADVYHSIETKAGTLWFATSRGVARYVPDAGAPKRFVTYSLGDSLADIVNTMCEDPHGGLWLGTARGLYHASPAADGLHARLVLRPDEPAGIEPPAVAQILALLLDSQGVLWASTHYAGIYRIHPSGTIEHYTTANGLPANVAGSLLEDHSGRIWFSTPHGLLQLATSPKPGSPIVSQTVDTSYGLSENTLHGLVETSDGHIWFGSQMGLAEFDGTRIRTYATENGLAEKRVFSLAVTREGNLWVGTTSSGIMRLARNGFTTYREPDGIRSGPVSTLLEARQGPLLAVTMLREEFPVHSWNGLRFDRTSPRFPADVKSFGWGMGQQLLQDHLGEWWVATFDGLCRFPATKSASELSGLRPKRRYTKNDGLPGDNIYGLFEDSAGDIWIGINFRERRGLARWKRTTDRIEDLSQAPGSLTNRTPASFVEDASGSLWIGYEGGGLSRYHDGRFTSFTEREGLPAGTLRLYLDPADTLWGAALSGGVFRVDARTTDHPKFVRFIAESGPGTNRTNVVSGDLHGRIYAGTIRGVDRIDPATGHIAHLTVADGLANNMVISAFRDRDGDLWFGTESGLSKLSIPRNVATKPTPPAVRITEIRIDDRAVPLSDLGDSAANGLDTGGLEIRARENHVQIAFAGIDLDSPLRFQFKLDGSDHDWSPPSPQQTVVYPGMPTGKFRFLVRAINADDAISPAVAWVSFNVLPPLWQRWWFILLAGAALAGVVWRWQQSRVARLLEVERLRTRIATDLHDDIGASLSHISLLSELAHRNIGEAGALSGYLSQIAEVSQSAAAAMGDVVWAINPNRDSLNDLVLRMRRFASDVLGARDIEIRFLAPEAESSRKLDSDTRRQLFLIFKEAVNNVARHAQATAIDIDLRIDGDSVILNIRDNGKGFDLEQSTDGQGLASLRLRAQRLHGTLSIQSSAAGPAKGTALKLRAPLR